MTRLLALVLCLGVALLTAPAPAAAQAPPTAATVWKMGTATGPDSPINLAAAILDKTLQEKSKGRMKIELHLGNSIAKGEAAHLEGAQLGTIDIVPIGSAPIGGMFEPLYQALDLPFLWSSREQVWKVMDGPLGQELLKKMEAKGLRAFCFGGGWGFRNMMSNKRAIFTPEDMKGQTIRVQESPTYIALMKALGANPVPMPYVEVYLAMKQGTIDGMELPSFTVTADKFQEVTKFYSLTRHSYPAHRVVRQPQEVPGPARRSPEGPGRVHAGGLRCQPEDRGRAREVGLRHHAEGGHADQRGEGHQAVPGADEARLRQRRVQGGQGVHDPASGRDHRRRQVAA